MGMASVKKQDTWDRGCVKLGQIQSCIIPQPKLRLPRVNWDFWSP